MGTDGHRFEPQRRGDAEKTGRIGLQFCFNFRRAVALYQLDGFRQVILGPELPTFQAYRGRAKINIPINVFIIGEFPPWEPLVIGESQLCHSIPHRNISHRCTGKIIGIFIDEIRLVSLLAATEGTLFWPGHGKNLLGWNAEVNGND